MNSQNRTFSCPTTPQDNPRGGVMKTRGKVTCDLEKISYIPINEKTIPNIFSVIKGAILSTKVSKCHVATAHVNSIFLAIFCCSSDKIWGHDECCPCDKC